MQNFPMDLQALRRRRPPISVQLGPQKPKRRWSHAQHLRLEHHSKQLLERARKLQLLRTHTKIRRNKEVRKLFERFLGEVAKRRWSRQLPAIVRRRSNDNFVMSAHDNAG